MPATYVTSARSSRVEALLPRSSDSTRGGASHFSSHSHRYSVDLETPSASATAVTLPLCAASAWFTTCLRISSQHRTSQSGPRRGISAPRWLADSIGELVSAIISRTRAAACKEGGPSNGASLHNKTLMPKPVPCQAVRKTCLADQRRDASLRCHLPSSEGNYGSYLSAFGTPCAEEPLFSCQPVICAIWSDTSSSSVTHAIRCGVPRLQR